MKIKRIVLLFLISFLCGSSFSQTDKLFTSIDEALKVHPDSVFRIDLSRKQLKTIPEELFQFKNLRELRLDHNKLTSLPDNFFFEDLEILDLTKNKFEIFPESICKNINLTQLLIGKNNLTAFPESIRNLQNLVVLDAWFNKITEIPESITELKKLRSLDLRGMNYSEEFQRKWIKLLPWVKIEFDLGCDCGY